MNKNKISNLVHIISGGTPKTSNHDFWNGDIGWLSVADFNNNNRYVYTSEKTISRAGLTSSSTKLLQKNDIIISARGTVGALAQIGIPMCFNQSCFGLRGKEGIIDNTFLYYCLKNYVANIKKRSQGSVFDTINLNTFDLMEIDYPESLSTQQRIASVLAALDNKIELNKCINAELEAMAKNLYDYWFVQFDFPDKNGKPYKSSGGKMFYNDTLKREIPEGWNVNELGNVAQTSLGGTPATKNMEYWNDADSAWLSSAEIAEFPVIDSDQRITQKGIENSAAVLLPKGSVVISIVRYIRPSILGIDAATNQSVVGIRETEKLRKSFIYPFMCSEVPRLMSLRSGAQQPHINKGTIDETLIIIPSEDIFQKYYKLADPFFSGIMTHSFETKELINLRNWLLPMLMNGQVTVK